MAQGAEFGLLFWALAGLSALSGVLYGLFYLDKPPTLLRAIAKTAFMALLAAAFFVADLRGPLVLALAAAAAGDFLLGFDKKWTLPLGILAFLICQLFYLLIFTFLWFDAPDGAPLLPRYIATGAIILTAIGFLVWMAPKLGWMAFGVVPYAIAITGMASMAMWLPWIGWPAMVGAVLFLISDFVLAAELFRLPPDAPVRRITAPAVWWTYVGAQIGIALGILSIVRAGG
jgi:uncharacterized membrane protein YhhN